MAKVSICHIARFSGTTQVRLPRTFYAFSGTTHVLGALLGTTHVWVVVVAIAILVVEVAVLVV